MTNKTAVLIILALSIITHFAFFGYPNETVFDEVHFGKFVSGYYTGEYYFDIHPPLGKLMIAGFAKLFDFKPEFSFTEIGKEFPDNKYLVLRFLPALAGLLLPLIVYLLILELGMSRIAAFTGGLLIVFENALLTQSRFILLDSFLFLFGFASLLLYFKKRYLLMAVFGGLAVSIKWVGLSFIALPILIEVYTLWFPARDGSAFGRKGRSFVNFSKFTSYFIISAAVYFLAFALHFTFLPNPGSGDAFMKPDFRKNNMVKNIWDLNIEMYKSNQRLTATHPYSSQWYTWPLMIRPIYYWVKDSARIYLFGNPVIWWASMIAVAISIKYLVLSIKKRAPDKVLAILLGGYFLNLLPFIGVKRVMFLYHYLTALIFAIMMLCYLVDKSKNSRKIFAGTVIAAIAAFIFFAPLSYGLPLSQKTYEARVWFASWR
ncbi:MAG: hypothetical protein A2655_00620 [Candidatus Yanofskybacteria bacterium RIFCSPHIGHO2_01_FULL_43_42]|uniref:Polyprenol-phosphate-mannose--protein mannosyltransferase n=1 Tax=Candidatus Yanofskybacteria bacterium RIFCSPLOWO2_01_FULL_43_22 TaxID=1802695 RepID=A0A1F8GFW1_9BACT|nr:MAG: hypothetical protein A2655_00620 [Candidatus Yanofskybacteria bacterium RIFCSPHIGHO2_01_FULL_43_42]OGN13758.1 MAG: hypothetical protein A3D48_00370 [Candidatus Yanofskybacteria bacterium RIFCSPHIGHO2_02_FULL_43_17]OGN24277.1 MAG: hypothetical protein A3A13_03820 [Candidatus Yanofskybacteria bacterium RIFCSPLOWO2_01_FULL_43_22]